MESGCSTPKKAVSVTTGEPSTVPVGRALTSEVLSVHDSVIVDFFVLSFPADLMVALRSPDCQAVPARCDRNPTVGIELPHLVPFAMSRKPSPIWGSPAERVPEARAVPREALASARPSWDSNQFLNRGTMRLRCMSTLKIAVEPPCTPASGPWLSPGYGSGPPATMRRNRGAEHRRPRKCLGANGMR